ncbi:MAG: DUF4350 domain-containing protein [Microbacterium sp.]
MTAHVAAPPAVEVREPSRRRRVAMWVVIGIVILIVGAIGATMSDLGRFTEREALDPESPAPAGARAVVEILRDQGIEVIVARDRTTAATALEGGGATLVLPDSPALSDSAVKTLGDAATDLVLIDPRARTLRIFLPGSTVAGVGDGAPIEPDCDLAEAQRSGAVAPGALFDPSGGAVTVCYATAAGAGLLVQNDGAHRHVAVDGRALFTNDTLAESGNAALALNLMGRNAVVVWYMPSIGDSDLEGDEFTLGELTPPWVSPVIVLLLVAGVAAGIWRGRRFGPLVAERLPVTVRASETTEGRARLYANARDALHAADLLRIGALARISRALALGPAASAPEIADAAAARTGLDRAAVRGILLDDIPAGDGDLVALRGRLHDLEDAVHTAVRPERNTR